MYSKFLPIRSLHFTTRPAKHLLLVLLMAKHLQLKSNAPSYYPCSNTHIIFLFFGPQNTAIARTRSAISMWNDSESIVDNNISTSIRAIMYLMDTYNWCCYILAPVCVPPLDYLTWNEVNLMPIIKMNYINHNKITDH